MTCCFIAYLSSSYRTASCANYWTIRTLLYCNDNFVIGAIRTCLGVSSYPMFLWIPFNSCQLTLLLVQSHLAEIILVKHFIILYALRAALRARALSLLGGFEQAANLVDKNSKKSTGTLDRWKLLSRCGFLQPQSSHCNEKVCGSSNNLRLTLSGNCYYCRN